MQNGFVETLIGAAVVTVAAVFFYYGWNTTESGAVQGYELVAKFERIDGINVGTDVRLSGIKIGTVTSQDLDAKSYRAVVKMNIKNGIPIPDDSSVKVASEGLLGGRDQPSPSLLQLLVVLVLFIEPLVVGAPL